MTEEKIETAKGLCVVTLTKRIMSAFNLTPDAAYEKLLGSELYSLLMDTETRLIFESDDYLRRCCDIEFNEGVEALYQFINDETVDL